jgi:hypothetical protein
MITIDSNARYSIFTVTNWTLYQSSPNRGSKTTSTALPTANATARSTAREQGSFDDIATNDATDIATAAQPLLNQSATRAQHYNKNKNKKENIENTDTNVSVGIAQHEEIGLNDSKVEYGDPQINSMFVFWKHTVGYDISSQKQANRNACKNLIKRFGDENLRELIRAVDAAQQHKFGPTISDFCDLQSNQNKLFSWIKKHAANEGIIRI